MARTIPVTAVVTAFNRRPFVEECLRSLWQQTALPERIIVVDDASTDGTADLVAELAPHSPVRLSLIRRSINSGGCAVPTDAGVEAAATDLVALLDSDDTSVPERLEWQYEAVMRAGDRSSLCFGLTQNGDTSGAPVAKWDLAPDDILTVRHTEMAPYTFTLEASDCYQRLVGDKNFIGGLSAFLFSKKAWARVGGFNPRYQICCDLDFACRMCAVGPLVFVSRVTHMHRLHGGNIAGSAIRTRRELMTLRAEHVENPCLPVAEMADLRRQLPTLLLSQGYWESRDGRLGMALDTYWRALRAGAPVGAAASGAIKAFPHRLLAGWNRAWGVRGRFSR
jgi:glycosyltransferase involved in cell wall biosynthesis